MNIQTMTVLAGTTLCNAKCPYCISRMTPVQGVRAAKNKVNWRNFRKACLLAQKSGVNTVIISGKGEPTIYPAEITQILKELKHFQFPLIELQTNALLLDSNYSAYKKHLLGWCKLGLNTISISVVSHDKEKNKKIFTSPNAYINLARLTQKLHELGFSVRLACVMLKGYTDSPKEIIRLLEFAKENRIEQVTARPVNMPYFSSDKDAELWAKCHALSAAQKKKISSFFEKNAAVLIRYPFGATVYDYKDQNFCLTNSLTIDSKSDSVRQLIFFPDGHLRYDWQYKGAVII